VFDLDAQRARRATITPPVVARLAGTDITFRPALSAAGTAEAVNRITSAGDEAAQVVAIIGFLVDACTDEDRDRFAGILLNTADPITAADLADLYVWLCGQYAARATPAEAEPTPHPRKPTTSLDDLRRLTSTLGIDGVVKE
jgi:hypothetical protein